MVPRHCAAARYLKLPDALRALRSGAFCTRCADASAVIRDPDPATAEDGARGLRGTTRTCCFRSPRKSSVAPQLLAAAAATFSIGRRRQCARPRDDTLLAA